ncbi:hypothetical protein PAP_09635 [Palaeococcus pacificus DY20341]|uniref:YgjP-like metallopeptidase domain-containing protein n=1 Tax=Palaeococcus pacificus DY20341 TaxID=1343739 RepID=A0A075LW92_9EURY|nr:SprT family zinc-dependent metalloprotease [Palaeococcus pacificus]AIF70302.1 hypothetical protein PAP_09635 [Palaeococcus pacificus DY20341]
MPEIELGGKRIHYELILKRVKYLRVYLAPDGRLIVVSPTRNVEPILKAKKAWILNKINRIEKIKELSSKFPYLGRFYDVEEGESFNILEDKIFIPTRKQLERNLRKELKSTIEPLIEERAKVLGVEPNKLFVRKQKTRWGSCSAKGNLSFNLALMALPKSLIDYVVTHEVAHLRKMNHSKDFWSLVSRFHPDWKKKRKELKDWWLIVHNNQIWKDLLEGKR